MVSHAYRDEGCIETYKGTQNYQTYWLAFSLWPQFVSYHCVVHRFESIYLDDKIRIAKDIRGDTLIVAKDGPPRIFN
eukprot:scaffold638592_cov56-Prasinocladus_malaysianus.AAC.1